MKNVFNTHLGSLLYISQLPHMSQAIKWRKTRGCSVSIITIRQACRGTHSLQSTSTPISSHLPTTVGSWVLSPGSRTGSRTQLFAFLLLSPWHKNSALLVSLRWSIFGKEKTEQLEGALAHRLFLFWRPLCQRKECVQVTSSFSPCIWETPGLALPFYFHMSTCPTRRCAAGAYSLQ